MAGGVGRGRRRGHRPLGREQRRAARVPGAGRGGRARSCRTDPRARDLAAGAVLGGLASPAGSVRADRHADRRRRRRVLAGGLQRPAAARAEGHDVGGGAALHPRAIGRRAAQQGRARRAAAAAAGRTGPRRRRPGSAVPRRAGPSRDRPGVRAVASARLGAAGRVGADRRGAAAAAPHDRAAADPVGARELWGGARHLDQPGVCRRVRVRPPTRRQTPRRARPGARRPRRRPDRGVVCLPARSPSRLCQLGSSTSPPASGCERT